MKFFIALLFCVFCLHSNLFSQWEKCAGGDWHLTGLVNSIVHDDEQIYACTNKGLYISSDKGDSWYNKKSNLPDSNIYCIAVHKENVYVSLWGKGLFFAKKDEYIWTKINSGLNSSYIYTILSFDDYIFLGTLNGIYLSSDNGQNWIKSSNSNSQIYSMIKVGKNIFATSSDAGIMVTEDYGLNWKVLESSLSIKEVYSLNHIDSNIIAGTSSGIYISSNWGNDWKKTNLDISYNPIMSIAVDSSRIYITTYNNGLFKSEDLGDNWINISSNLKELAFEKVTYLNKQLWAVSRNGKLYISSDYGLSWDYKINNVSKVTNGKKIISGKNKLYVSSSSGLVFYSTNKGYTWYKMLVDSSKWKEIISIAVYNDNIFAITSEDAFRSLDDGKSWQPIIRKVWSDSYLKMIIVDSIPVIGTWQGNIFFSFDMGSTLENRRYSLPTPGLRDMVVADGQIVTCWYDKGVYISPNYGVWWIKRHKDYGLDGFINCLGASGKNVLAYTNSGLYKSTDQGNTWLLNKELKNNFDVSIQITKIAMLDNNYFFDSNLGFYYSTDHGSTWNHIDRPGNIENTDFDNEYIYAICNGTPFKRKLSDFGITLEIEINKSQEYIMDIYPNPISSNNVIILKKPNEYNCSNLTLSLYDILGNKIKQFIDIDFSQNETTINWDGTDNFGNELPNGVYFLILQAGDNTISKKIIISK